VFSANEDEMVNKDYLMRQIELFTRRLTILLGLRQYDKFEEAFIYVDDLYLQMLGMTSHFVNSLSEKMLLEMISPLGVLNVDKCLWLAVLLKAEGDIYDDQGKDTESYYRYLKSLFLFLSAFSYEKSLRDTQLGTELVTLLDKLDAYELPLPTGKQLFVYYELYGQYDKAENTLFEMLEREDIEQTDHEQLLEDGKAFFERLLRKSDSDLLAGNFSRVEVQEGIAQLA